MTIRNLSPGTNATGSLLVRWICGATTILSLRDIEELKNKVKFSVSLKRNYLS
jgi:hypothetical protein